MSNQATIELLLPQVVKKGETFPIEVYLDTGSEKTVGTDLLLSYDPSDLSFVKVIQTNFYSNYHPPKIYSDKNQIRYSGTSDYQNYVQGSGLFTTLIFSKKKSGKPTLDLIWQNGNTNDTNVIGIDGSDLLQQKPIIKYLNPGDSKPTKSNFNNKPTEISSPSPSDKQVLGEMVNATTQTPDTFTFADRKTPQSIVSNRFYLLILLFIFIIIGLFWLVFLAKKRKRQKDDQ